MKLYKDKMLPIQYTGWDQGDNYGDIIFYNSIFLEDFGQIKKDDCFKSIFLSVNKGIIEFYTNTEDENPSVTIDVHIKPNL